MPWAGVHAVLRCAGPVVATKVLHGSSACARWPRLRSCDNEKRWPVLSAEVPVTLISNTIRIVPVVLAGLLLASLAVAAELDRSDVQTAWRLLDYIAVDYDGAVANGIVSNPTEYAGQTIRLNALLAPPVETTNAA